MRKICSCKRAFITSNPKHSQCRSCHRLAMRAKVQAEAKRADTERLRKECAAERNSMREAIRQALLSKQLPKSAQVLGDRNQVVVSWMGRSHTFHLPSAAFA